MRDSGSRAKSEVCSACGAEHWRRASRAFGYPTVVCCSVAPSARRESAAAEAAASGRTGGRPRSACGGLPSRPFSGGSAARAACPSSRCRGPAHATRPLPSVASASGDVRTGRPSASSSGVRLQRTGREKGRLAEVRWAAARMTSSSAGPSGPVRESETPRGRPSAQAADPPVAPVALPASLAGTATNSPEYTSGEEVAIHQAAGTERVFARPTHN